MLQVQTSLMCHWCEEVIDGSEHVVIYQGEEVTVCEACFSDETFECDGCRDYFHLDEEHYVESYRSQDCRFCEDCYDENTFRCEWCDDRRILREEVSDDSISICMECWECEGLRCDGCECLIHRNNDYYSDDYGDRIHCPSCGPIRGWFILDDCYKPYRWNYYFAPGERVHSTLYGIELEVDEGGFSDYNAEEVVAFLGGENKVFTKGDGSLEDGFEIVTHPMSMRYHQEVMPWAGALRLLRSLNYTSHNSGTCGIHVHVSRTAFGATSNEQDQRIALLLFIMERYWEQWRRFSRRSKERMQQWARKYLSEHEILSDPKNLIDTAKGRIEKYAAINIAPYDTVEIRIFRGSLRYASFMAALELVDALVAYVNTSSPEETQVISWPGLRDQLSVYENLKEYFVCRNL